MLTQKQMQLPGTFRKGRIDMMVGMMLHNSDIDIHGYYCHKAVKEGSKDEVQQ
mgnify:CR=1 FL=1